MGFVFSAVVEVASSNHLLASLLKQIAIYVKLIFMVALLHMGLLDDDQVTVYSPSRCWWWWSGNDQQDSEVLSMSGGGNLLSPNMLDAIKKRLPIVKFGDFADRLSAAESIGRDGDCQVEDESDTVCAVCMSCMERKDEMRELPNCCHVFHRECLDKWVDQSQITCPICRSMLLSSSSQTQSQVRLHHEQSRQETCSSSDIWLVERISYLFGEDLW